MRKYFWLIFYCIGIIVGMFIASMSSGENIWVNENVFLWLLICCAIGAGVGFLYNILDKICD